MMEYYIAVKINNEMEMFRFDFEEDRTDFINDIEEEGIIDYIISDSGSHLSNTYTASSNTID